MRLARSPVLHLTVGERTVRAEAVRRRAPVWVGEAAYESVADLSEVIARLASAPGERCRRLQVTLERPPAQTRTLTDLPPVRQRELRSLVANQAGRFFRRNGAALVTDATWIVNGGGRITQAAAVEEPLVLAVMSGANQAGLVVESITAAGVSAALQLLPNTERVTRGRMRRRMVMRMTLAASAVWVLAGVLFGAQLVMERRSIDAELAAADAPLAALRDVRQEMRTVESMIVGLNEARRARGEALAALARVSAAVPDSTVVTSYTWRGDGSGLVAGAGRRAADVLAAIERTHAVANPRISGAVVRETLAGHEWERFTILFGAATP